MMDFDCFSQNVSILCLRKCQKSSNICVFCKYYYFSLRKHYPNSSYNCNAKSKYFAVKNQDPSKILKVLELKVHLIKYIYENYN